MVFSIIDFGSFLELVFGLADLLENASLQYACGPAFLRIGFPQLIWFLVGFFFFGIAKILLLIVKLPVNAQNGMEIVVVLLESVDGLRCRAQFAFGTGRVAADALQELQQMAGVDEGALGYGFALDVAELHAGLIGDVVDDCLDFLTGGQPSVAQLDQPYILAWEQDFAHIDVEGLVPQAFGALDSDAEAPVREDVVHDLEQFVLLAHGLTYNNGKVNNIDLIAMAERVVPMYQNYEERKEYTCYESVLNCCGTCTGCMRAWAPCCCCWCPYPYYKISQGSVGLKETFGRFEEQLEPGLHYVNPCTARVIPVSLRTM